MNDFAFDAPPTAGTNRAAPASKCRTCGGDRFVLTRLRSTQQTQWQAEHNIVPRKDLFHEEYSPCPDCHPSVDISYWQADGRKFQGLDTAAVREALNR